MTRTMAHGILRKTYYPTHAENRMRHEGDVARARTYFLSTRFRNLEVLLQTRYQWMNAYLDDSIDVIELGSGAGFSREFIHNKNLRLTDIEKHPWIDEQVDALELRFSDASLDAVICSHMIHHLAKPMRFFRQTARKLKPGGLILIQDINTSFLMRVLLRMMRHEGWSYDVDVFDERAIANDPADPWAANCAIPALLFDDPARFEAMLPGLRVIRNELCECLLFPLSGGVIARTAVPELPFWCLRLVQSLDTLLIAAAPKLFAMGRRVVIQREK